MQILMTGATGFIGSHVAGHLLKAGSRVRALVRPSSKTEALAALGAEIRVGDLNDKTFMADAIDGCDIIINAAGRLGRWSVSENELRRANVGLVKTLLESAQGSSVKQFIHFSTPGVVGMVGVAPECMPARPSGPYERTKLEAEKLALAYHKNGSVPVTILRPDFVYGPGDLHKLRMFKAIKEGRFPVLGRGTSLLHPTYIDDVVNGTMLVIGNEQAYGHVFNLAGPSVVTVRELVSEIADVLDVEIKAIPIPPVLLKLGAFGVETFCRLAGKEPPVTRQQIRFFTADHASDISKAQSMIGYQPRIYPGEGVEWTVNWYRQEGYL